MFSIFYCIFYAFGAIASGTKAAIRNQHQIERWKNAREKGDNPNNIYIDRRGVKRDLNNNAPVTLTHLYRTGDVIRKEGYEGNQKINVSEQWRNEQYQKMRVTDTEHTVFPDIKIVHAHPNDTTAFEEGIWRDSWYAEGQWWKDYKTSALYCVREIDVKYNNKTVRIECYMDVSTGLLVRISDDQCKKNIPLDICNKAISDYNKGKSGKPSPKSLYEWNRHYLNHRIAEHSGYFYLREVQDMMERAGCCPV